MVSGDNVQFDPCTMFSSSWELALPILAVFGIGLVECGDGRVVFSSRLLYGLFLEVHEAWRMSLVVDLQVAAATVQLQQHHKLCQTAIEFFNAAVPIF